MTLRLPKVHQIPHMHSWADELLAQSFVSARDAHALAYSVEQHGLGMDRRLMDKVDRVRALTGTSGAALAVDADSHLNDDAHTLAQLSQDIESLADAMEGLDQTGPAPKLVESRVRRGRGKRT